MIHRWRECFGIGVVFGGTASIFFINLAIDHAIDRMRLNKRLFIDNEGDEM